MEQGTGIRALYAEFFRGYGTVFGLLSPFSIFPLELDVSSIFYSEFSGHSGQWNRASNPMTPFGLLIGVLVICVPIAWFVAEFQDRRWLRLILGSFAILLSFGVAALVGWAERFISNAWFSEASKNLVDATIAELEAGNREGVIRSLKSLQKTYSPTYENRARYDVLIEETVTQMRSSPQQSP
jgi:hypothetical protein